MKIIKSAEFDSYWKNRAVQDDEKTESLVKEIIAAVRAGGDEAVRGLASRFDKSSPAQLEVSLAEVVNAADELRKNNPDLYTAMELSIDHLKRFSLKQKEQFKNFEYEMEMGLVTGQQVIPVEGAAIYVPSGRFPLFSTVLMGLIPAFCAGVEEVVLASPPQEDGLPSRNILAAAGTVLGICKTDLSFSHNSRLRVFAMGGAQAIAALAYGTESVPRVDFIAGPGNKYVAAAKRLLYGQVGIDFIAGPSDVLIIADGKCGVKNSAEIAAADLIAQAEHDPDACSRLLTPSIEFAWQLSAEIEKQLTVLPSVSPAAASLDKNGLIVVYQNKDEAVRISNSIAPEHLELQTEDDEKWIPLLKNYGSLFIGPLSAEILGDYSAGINHTLPTSGSSRFTGGLSVRNFLKIATTLRCSESSGFEKTRSAAQFLAEAEELKSHAKSAELRKTIHFKG